jgi:release factor glutamine methyltransferase
MEKHEISEIQSKGFHTFCGFSLRVAPNVLVPRAETEILANTALEVIKDIPNPRIIDMCAGCGNITCTLALQRRDAKVFAADLTTDCVRLISENVAHHSLQDSVTVRQGDLFDALSDLDLDGSVDLVTCNPPYIPTRRLETDRSSLLEMEPREAFEAGAYGIDIIQRVVSGAARFLAKDRPLCFEFGLGQHKLCTWLLERSELYHSIRMVNDADASPRVAVAYRK